MLLFITRKPSLTGYVIAFQYISCYCLSTSADTVAITIGFQYISCYCLSIINCNCDAKFILISIHLMLLFIEFSRAQKNLIPEFQYISCYCLSVIGNAAGFNVYIFQYISCYCLSRPLHLIPLPFRGFQYISCYCLSSRWCSAVSCSRISIHLMLLFIFIVNRLLFEQFYFNTSHVTVYQIFLFPPRI